MTWTIEALWRPDVALTRPASESALGGRRTTMHLSAVGGVRFVPPLVCGMQSADDPH